MLRDFGLGILIIVALFCTAGGYFAGNKMKDDNVAEQFIEDQIEEKTGIDVDLSSKTPDPDGHGAPVVQK